MNKKEFNNKFETELDALLNEASAGELAKDIAGSANNMLVLGLVKNLHRLARAQEEQSAFLNELRPIITYFAERAKREIEAEEKDRPQREELRQLRREQEQFELLKAKARREHHGDLEKEAREEEARVAAKQKAAQARDEEYERLRALETIKPAAGMKLRIAQNLGPKYPNLHVGGTIEIKYIDCFKAKEDDWRAEPKVVFEQGLIVGMDEWKNLITNEVLTVIAD